MSLDLNIEATVDIERLNQIFKMYFYQNHPEFDFESFTPILEKKTGGHQLDSYGYSVLTGVKFKLKPKTKTNSQTWGCQDR